MNHLFRTLPASSPSTVRDSSGGRFVRLALTATLILSVSGCSLWGGGANTPEGATKEAEKGEKAPSEVANSDAGQVVTNLGEGWLTNRGGTAGTITVVNLTWQRPDEAVTAYYLNYGFEEKRLENRVRVAVADLEKSDDPRFGPVYRYRLRGVPREKPVYVTLQAENDRGISEPTPVMVVKPD